MLLGLRLSVQGAPASLTHPLLAQQHLILVCASSGWLAGCSVRSVITTVGRELPFLHGRWSSAVPYQVTVTTASLLAAHASAASLYSDQNRP